MKQCLTLHQGWSGTHNVSQAGIKLQPRPLECLNNTYEEPWLTERLILKTHPQLKEKVNDKTSNIQERYLLEPIVTGFSKQKSKS